MANGANALCGSFLSVRKFAKRNKTKWGKYVYIRRFQDIFETSGICKNVTVKITKKQKGGFLLCEFFFSCADVFPIPYNKKSDTYFDFPENAYLLVLVATKVYAFLFAKIPHSKNTNLRIFFRGHFAGP